MPSSKPLQRFEDIVYNIDAIVRHTAGLDETAFVTNALVIDAVERCLSRISEAAVKLGEHATLMAPDQLRHEYGLISPRDIWAIVTGRLPALRAACEKAARALGDPST